MKNITMHYHIGIIKLRHIPINYMFSWAKNSKEREFLVTPMP
jgi:hypothetical protein